MTSAICAVIALVGAVRFGLSVQAMFLTLREFLDAKPEVLGTLFGGMQGQYFAALSFSWLAWKLWRVADDVETNDREVEKAEVSIIRRLIAGACKWGAYFFSALTVVLVIEASVGAFAIIFATDPLFDHSLFKLDYTHELYFLLPIAEAFICLLLMLIFRKLEIYLARKKAA